MSLIDFKTPRFNIMVSSVVKGLESERRAIKEALETVNPHFRVWLSEDWSGDSHSSEETCTTIARDCQFFILLLGKHYGKPPKGLSISVTEMEFKAALAASRQKIRVYLKPARNVEPKQATFIKRVRDFRLGLQCPSFHGLEQLKAFVLSDAITFYGDKERLSDQPSPVIPSTIAPDLHLSETKEQTFLPQTDSPSHAHSADLLKQQRDYLQTIIRYEPPATLARRVILNLGLADLRDLALVSQANILARKQYLEALFPKKKWDGFIRRMHRRGLLGWTKGYFQVAKNVGKQLEHDSALTQEAQKKWVSTLEPKAMYWDLALALCLHLMTLKRFSEAITLAHSMILSIEDHIVAKLFYSLLVSLRAKRIHRKVAPRDRIILLDAIGIALGHDNRIPDSLRVFNSMLAVSRRANDNWGIAQALLHRGVAWAQIGDNRKAVRSYRQAAVWARKGKDYFLLGRALHNWSQSLVTDNPKLAGDLLARSIRYKNRAGDREGLFGIYTGRGILAGQAGRHRVALHWFRRAEREARHGHSLYNQSHALHNQARSYSHLGKLEAAVRLSKKALERAEALGRKDLILLTAEGKAAHCYGVQDYKTALPLFLRVFALKREKGDIHGAIVALSDAGIMEMFLKHYDAAKSYLRRAILLSKSTEGRHWLVAGIRNYTEICRAEGNRSKSEPYLRGQIRWAERAEEWSVTAELAAMLAQLLIAKKVPVQTIEQAWTKAIAAAQRENNGLKQLQLLRQRYGWIRETQTPDAAARALQPFLRLTRRVKRFRRDYVEALGEMGTCLQQQEKYEEAESCYREAMSLTQRDSSVPVPGSLLNNYAELLRKTARSRAAIPLYKEALAIDQSRGDPESQLLTEHNLALALDDSGRGIEARQFLKSIQKTARKKQLWEHYVRAWLALADSAWMNNQRGIALRRYSKVQSLCKRYQLESLGLHATLNQARLLQELNRSQEALAFLQSLQGRFQISEHCIALYLTLGNCLIECGKYGHAVEVLERGLLCPQAKYLTEGVGSLRTALVEASLKARQIRKSRRQIEKVLAGRLAPADRVEWLTALLSIVATAEAARTSRGRETQRLLEDIHRIATDNKQPAWISRSHEQLGNVLWNKNRKAAAQVFTIGMIKTIENGHFEEALKLGVRLGVQLHRLGLAKGKQSVQRLEKEIHDWLRDQLKRAVSPEEKSKNIEAAKWLLWPFPFALRILHRPDQGRRIKADEISLLCRESLLPAGRWGEGKGTRPFSRRTTG